MKFELGLFENPYTEVLPDNSRFLLPSSLDVAEQLAQESMVLLKNDKGVLPLKKEQPDMYVLLPCCSLMAENWWQGEKAKDI